MERKERENEEGKNTGRSPNPEAARFRALIPVENKRATLDTAEDFTRCW